MFVTFKNCAPSVDSFSFFSKIDFSKPISNIVFSYFHSNATSVNSLIYFSNIKFIKNLLFI
ncbi:hypothetical protein LEP1GSC041_3368 [Leptospira noguchii str. 2006001870]|nr:hypothetical protein LEP1GSC041_3368 [Leptospira noguchii str. 2006001870]